MNQQQVLKKMSGVKRLEQALLLSDFTRQLSKKNIEDQCSKRASGKKLYHEQLRRLIRV